MRKLMGLKVALLVVSLLMVAAVPATAQLADPLSLAASGALLPFFNSSGNISLFEIITPVPTGAFNNNLHMVFFNATCARQQSMSVPETEKQALVLIGAAPPMSLNYDGLAAIAGTANLFDLTPLSFPIHTRTWWIDFKNVRIRAIDPVTIDTYHDTGGAGNPLIVNPPAAPGLGSPFVWNALRTGATFVVPQESGTVHTALVLVCPRSSIQQGNTGGGVFGASLGFARMWAPDVPAANALGGFLPSSGTGGSQSVLRGLIFDDDETPGPDFTTPCDCLTAVAPKDINSIFTFAPTQVFVGGFANTLPVWYVELQTVPATVAASTSGSTGGTQDFAFTGYWDLSFTGTPITMFHRLSNSSKQNLINGLAGGPALCPTLPGGLCNR